MTARNRIALAVAGALLAAVGWSAASASAEQHIAEPVIDGASANAPAERGERISLVPSTPATTPSVTGDPLLDRVLELTNAERARAGLPALGWNAQLAQAAQAHSEDQARRNTLTHYGPNGESPGDRISLTGYRYRSWAENAAMGYRSAESVMAGWMNSSGHRANILRTNVSEIGLGLAYSSGGVPYWTQVFAAPR